MNVTKTITIDLNRPKKNMVHLEQNDNTHIIHLVLLCDSVPFAPESGLTGVTKSVKYIASDGSGDENTGGVTIVSGKTNEYNVALNHGETAVPGFTEVFVVFSKNGNILHTFPITLDVIKTDPDISPSESAYGMFLRKDAQTAKTSSMTERAGIDDNGTIWFSPGGGGGLPELHIGDLGKVLSAVDSGEDDPEWGLAFVAEVTATITQSGSTYSVPAGTFTTLSNAVAAERPIAVYAPEGVARFSGVEGTALTFMLENDVGDVMTAVKYLIATNNSVTRTAWPVDNTAISPASIGAAVAVTVTTITDSSYQLIPVANQAYVFSNPVLALEVTSGFAATGDWSIEFDAPTNVAPSVTLPSALKTIPASPTFSANHHYEINCHNGYAVIAEW